MSCDEPNTSFYDEMAAIENAPPNCSLCHRVLSSWLSVRNHQEKYCRYRSGRKARQPAVARQRNVEIDDGEIEYWGADDVSSVIRTNVSMNGRARDYEMRPTESVMDVGSWLTSEEALVRDVFDAMGDCLIKGRLVLKAWFVKRNPATFEVLRRDMLHIASLPANLIHDFSYWYQTHVRGIINNLETLCNRDSDLEFDGAEALVIKFNLTPNLSGRSFFQLPDNLKRKQAVINVKTTKDCFKYALLSILYYNDIKKDRDRASKYNHWLNELEFGEVDASDVHIKKDVPIIEKLNKIKINVHVWEDGQLKGCVYNDHKVLSDRTLNILLVVGKHGERHYCGIPSLSRLYHHTKTTGNKQHMCERCIRSFSA